MRPESKGAYRWAGLLGIAALIMAIMGLLRLGSGMGMSLAAKVVLIVVMVIPLANLVTLLVINSRATARLKNAGYKVGLLGASK